MSGRAGQAHAIGVSIGHAASGSLTAPEPTTSPHLIETMRVEPGAAIPLLEGHLARLQHSSETLGYRWPGETTIRAELTHALAGLAGEQTWRLRLLLSDEGALRIETAVLASPAMPLKVVMNGPRSNGAERWLMHKTTHRP